MTYRGTVTNGVVVLETGTPLPDGTPVAVVPLAATTCDEPSEQEWLRAAAANPAFAFLNDPGEDVYTLADGKPFHDEG